MSITQVVSALALLVFGARLAESLRSRGSGAYIAVTQSAGAAAAIMLAVSAMLEWVAVRPDVLASARQPASCTTSRSLRAPRGTSRRPR